jgi:hypothetical protein
MTDHLHILPSDFSANGRKEYCPECAEIVGVLAMFPDIEASLDRYHESLSHPRAGLVHALGEGTWNCPTLVLHADSPAYESCGIKTENGARYIDNARDIGRYWAARFGTSVPRGTGPL